MWLRVASLASSLALSLAVLHACSGESGSPTGAGASGGAGGTGGSPSTSGSSSSGQGGDDGGGLFDVANEGSGGGPTLIYAHTDTRLFTLDPSAANLALTLVGDFDCIGTMAGQDTAMTDVAVDSAQNLWGVSAHDVHPLTIVGNGVHCGQQIPLGNPMARFYALTFAPVGVLDPAKEVLVAGNSEGELWAIDGQGGLTQHGSFGPVPADDGNGHAFANAGKAWELSGDIVFLANGGSPVGFATVRDCPNPPSTTGCNNVNTLIEIDLSKLGAAGAQVVTKSVRGQIVKRAGCSDATGGVYGNMYGIGAWNDKVYGFSRLGNLVDIDLADGTACLVKAYSGDKFAGAGVTTLAPIQPPPPK